MEFIPLTKKLYSDWDEFCEKSHDAWFWHTTSWLEYCIAFKPALESKSLSFFAKDNNKIVAVCPLFLEKINGHLEFSLAGGYGLVPALSSESEHGKDKYLKEISSRIDSLAKEHGVLRSSMRFPVLNDSFVKSEQLFNYLVKFGYLDTSINTHIIKVDKNIDELKRDVRHGHSYDVDRAEKIFTAEYCTKEDFKPDLFEGYKKMHKSADARKDRPELTYEILARLIRSGQAFLLAAKKDGEFAGFSYFFRYKNRVYYGSACNSDSFEKLPVSHFLQWQAIKYMNKTGVKIYETGWQRYGSSFADSPTPKEINISKFTRGFGGKSVPLFRGEKYYDRNYLKEVFESRLHKIKGGWFENKTP